MRNITNLISRHLAQYQSSCESFKNNVCVNPNGCHCQKWAEIWAHIDSTVPDEYRHFTLQNFTGMVDGKRVIDLEVYKAARDMIVKYCWNGVDPKEGYDQTWITKCILEQRRENGNSLIIYGNPWRTKVEKGNKPTKQPLGKTMLASIVMKEAIFQRVLGGHAADTYAWVPFTTLCNRLLAKAEGDENHSDEITLYEEVDWLVVDGIQVPNGNEAGRLFRANVLEKLFGERAEKNLPNILVFQDDISQFDDLSHDFGPSINAIINSRKTFRVAMLEKK